MFGECGFWYKMYWFEMVVCVLLLVYVLVCFVLCCIGVLVFIVDLLLILVELVGGQVDLCLLLEGCLLLLYLCDGSGYDEVIGEYIVEGIFSLLMMICCGDYKFIYFEQDFCLFYDLCNDLQECENFVVSLVYCGMFEVFFDEVW